MSQHAAWGARALGVLATVLFVLGVFAPGANGEAGFGDQKFNVGDKAADFTSTDMQGNTVTLSSFRGDKVVLLNFWGVRCGACIEEMPHLDKLKVKYEGKVAVLGVNTDGLPADVLAQTMAEMNNSVDYTLLIDSDFTITDVYTNFLVPLTLVIDREGIVTYIHTGYESGMEKDYEEAVVKALES